MPPPVEPNSDAEQIVAQLQRRVIHGISWISAVGAPCLVLLWEIKRWSTHVHPPLLLALDAVLLGGVLALVVRFRHHPPRQCGYFLMAWLSAASGISVFYNGPLASNGIAWASTAMLGVFLVGPAAGLAVVATYAAVVALHVLAVAQAWVAVPSDIAPAGGALTLLRIGIAGLIPLVMCYVGFRLLSQSFKEAVRHLVLERQRSEVARESQRQAEDTMRANQHFEALGKLARGVAHDVNNSLTTVQCNAELLGFALPPGDEQMLAQDILTAARTAAQTARQLLSLKRRAFCQPSSLSPAREVETVARLVTRLLPASIRLTAVDRTNRRILVDGADLQQALLNLVLNARDALPNGGAITLTVEEAPTGPDSNRIAIRVQDDGAGIDPAVLPRIFDPFFTTKSPGRGTGLGLAMTRAFVEEAGGTIEVDSAPGRGTTMSLYFPESPPTPALGLQRLTPPPDGSGLRVLLVEDETGLRTILERILVRGGYTVCAAATIEDALRHLENSPRFDLLCTDGISGPTPVSVLIESFRRNQPHAPVLLCTGNPDHEFIQGGLERTEIDLLRKPFTGTELLARVRALGAPVPPRHHERQG